MIRAIRGATTVGENTPEAIEEATLELMKTIINKNDLVPENIISVFFTLTSDLTTAYPASSARKIAGWHLVPMLCTKELDVPGGLSKCIRSMIHYQASKNQKEIKHVYLRNARCLRPDLL